MDALADAAFTDGPNGALVACDAARSLTGSGQRRYGSWLLRVRRVVPQEQRREMVHLAKLAGPVIISQLLVFMVSIVSLVFCGHLGKTELAGVSLAAAVVNITGVSVGAGLSSACDTLIAQTFGSGNLKRVGVILQRAILILLLACFPCWAVLINTEPLLLAVKQSPEVASLSQLYVKIFMPALPATFMYQLEGKYLQNQGIMWPQVITGTIGNVLNAVINYVFVYVLDGGVAGSAAANAVSQYLLVLLLYIYIFWRGLHKATWGGWSLDCLQEWGLFVRLAIPSMLMICLSWWLFEIGGFLAGLISEVELGAQSIAYQLCITAYMFPLGFSVAASIRVGNALGAGNTKQARLSCKVSIICAFTVACFVGANVCIARNVVGLIFTSEQDIIRRVADVLLIFGFMHVGDATAGVAAGVLRGAGKQFVGALCNLVGFYFIGFPIGVSLMFAAKMGIMGLWTGLTVCVSLQAVVFITFLYRLDWKKAADEALVRAGIQIGKEMMGMEQPGSNDDQATVRTGESSFVSAEEDVDLLGSVGEFTTTTTVGDVLSAEQLVLRRGLALLILVLVLVAGIVCSNLLMKLFK